VTALQAVYPEHQAVWQQHRGHGYWQSIQNQRSFFDALAVKLDIKSPEEWMKVSVTSVIESGGYFLNTYYDGSLVKGSYLMIKII
jgi:hypothetical protein